MNPHPYRIRSFVSLLGSAGLCLLASACGDDPTIIEPNDGAAAGRGGQTGSSGGSGGSGTSGRGGSAAGGAPNSGGSAGSPLGDGGSAGAGGAGGIVEVSGEITANTTWTSDNTYVLTATTFVVGAGTTLTIEPGTTIKGGGMGSALVVTSGSRLIAEGTAAAPIVFTSNVADGQRAAGNWAGVVLLGAAPINVEGGTDGVEGIDVTEGRGTFGGTDAAHDCGTLRYVRIEFAGFEIADGNELNGLTVGGCGSATELEYIQVHRGLDDGIEFFGGTVDVKHVVLSNNDDDSIDWDFGWTGRGQFVVVRHDTVHSDSGFESDNSPTTPYDQTPRSAPQLYNLTLVGNVGSTTGPAMNLRHGTWGVIRNAIVTGFPLGAIDVRDAASVAGTATTPPGLTVENSFFFQNGPGGNTHFGTTGTGAVEPVDGSADDDDAGFDELVWFTDVARANTVDTSPELADPTNVNAPNFVPAAGSPVAAGGATPPSDGFFDVAATYIGAIAPGGTDWTATWTSYPAN